MSMFRMSQKNHQTRDRHRAGRRRRGVASLGARIVDQARSLPSTLAARVRRKDHTERDTAELLADVAEGARTERYFRGLWVSSRSGVLVMAAIGAVGWFAYSVVASDHGLLRLWELDQQEKQLSARLDRLNEQEQQVQWELGEDPVMRLERPAREKFQMQRPGEIVFYFPRDGAASANADIEWQPARAGEAGQGRAPTVPREDGDEVTP